MPKRPIRSRLLQLRRELPQAEWLSRSLQAQQRLASLQEFAAAGTVAFYSPVRNEVDTDLLLRSCRTGGKRTVFPRVAGAALEFVEVHDAAGLSCGSFGVLEPCGRQTVPLAEVDLLLVPGVGFDLQGHRLGYGKGYYDRALEDAREGMLRVGLAFDFQVVPALPAEAHDVRLQLLVTDSAMYRFEPTVVPTSGACQRQS